METKTNANFWWVKSTPAYIQDSEKNLDVPKLNLHPSITLVDLLEKDKNSNIDHDVDVGSIIEEINKVAAQSPLGPYKTSIEERSVDDLMKEAEKIYLESSKSFEQLSQRSKTSQNISDLLSNLSTDSTPTPKSISPLPMDPDLPDSSESEEDYTEDFSEEVKLGSTLFSKQKSPHSDTPETLENEQNITSREEASSNHFIGINTANIEENGNSTKQIIKPSSKCNEETPYVRESANCKYLFDSKKDAEFKKFERNLELKDNLIQTLEEDNNILKCEIENVKEKITKSHSESIVFDLLKSLSTLDGPMLYADNFYSSSPLAEALFDQKMLYCGTFEDK
ncbi:hypothetical protein JTB14_032986 [Gonioctena quinquepunctata]|nr:hypothetical protein JTB14_032986 [Gonioctena quinquepunctata]